MKKVMIELLITAVLLVVLVFVGSPKLAAYLHNLGYDAYTEGNNVKAISYFQKALRFNPRSAVTHYSLGNAYMELDKEGIAVYEYQKAIRLDREYLPAYWALSQLYAKQGLYQESLSLLKQIEGIPKFKEEVAPLARYIKLRYAADCLDRGTDLLLSGEKGRAYSLIENAVRLRPDLAAGHYILAVCYASEAKLDQAVKELNEVTRIDRDFWLAYRLLGDIAFQKGKFEEAVNEYKNAFASQGNDADLCHSLGLALMQLERYKEALVYLNKAVLLDPMNADLHYSLASVYRDSGRFNEAMQEYGNLIRIKQDYPNVHNDLGDIYKNLGRISEASVEYRKEMALTTEKLRSSVQGPALLNNLAYAYNGLGESRKAEETIQKVISAWPQYRQAYLTLAKIYEGSGKVKEAMAALEKAKGLSTETNFMDRDISRLAKTSVVSDAEKLAKQDEDILKNNTHTIGWMKTMMLNK
jgi:tetratricopeptide (TPR) repeat protein